MLSPYSSSTKSFWLSNSSIPFNSVIRSTTTLPKKAKVVIIGGGFSGLSTAYWLAKNNVENVVLVESRGICTGATGRNGGNLFLTPHNYLNIPPQEAEFEIKGYELIRKFFEDENITKEIEYHNNGSMWLFHDSEEAQKWKLKLKECGKEENYWEGEKLASVVHSNKFAGAVFFPEGGQFYPAKLVYKILEKVLAFGVNIQTHTHVNQIINNTTTTTICTENGNIDTDYVVYATNAYTKNLLPILDDIVVPVRGQVIATTPIDIDLPHNMGIGDYEYMVQRRNDKRIIFGGFRRAEKDHEVGILNDNEISTLISDAIKNYLNDTFGLDIGNKNQIEYEWTGIMGFSKDRKPLIGPLPKSNNREFLCCGYTGHGMTRCFKADAFIQIEN
jgi:glycine/D-amino acid oxidase-like deaminating enzyme